MITSWTWLSRKPADVTRTKRALSLNWLMVAHPQ
jgi:hypothetical protein